MDNLAFEESRIRRLNAQFGTYFTDHEYNIFHAGTKYGFMTSFLVRYMELHSDPSNPQPFNARSSTTWGLAKAYLMYLNSVDVQNRRTIPDTYIQTDVLTTEEIGYLAGRGGVMFYDELTDRSLGIRDLIRFIDPEDYLNFIRWMDLYR